MPDTQILNDELNKEQTKFLKNLGGLNKSLSSFVNGINASKNEYINDIKKTGSINREVLENHTKETIHATKKLKAGTINNEIFIDTKDLNKSVRGLDSSTANLVKTNRSLEYSASKMVESTEELTDSMNDLSKNTEKTYKKFSKSLINNTAKLSRMISPGAIMLGLSAFKGAKSIVGSGYRMGTAPIRGVSNVVRSATESIGDQGNIKEELSTGFKKTVGMGIASSPFGLVPGMALQSLFKGKPKEESEYMSNTSSGISKLVDFFVGAGKKISGGAMHIGKGILHVRPDESFNENFDEIDTDIKSTNDMLGNFQKSNSPLYVSPSSEMKDALIGIDSLSNGNIGNLSRNNIETQNETKYSTNDILNNMFFPDYPIFISPSESMKEELKKIGISSEGAGEAIGKSITESMASSGKNGIFKRALGSIFGLSSTLGYILPVFGSAYRAELPKPGKSGIFGAMLKVLGMIYVHNRFASKEINDLILQQSKLLKIGFEIGGELDRPKPRSLSVWIGNSISTSLGKAIGGKASPFAYMKDFITGKAKGLFSSLTSSITTSLGFGKGKPGEKKGLAGLMDKFIPGYEDWKKKKQNELMEAELHKSPSMMKQLELATQTRDILDQMLMESRKKNKKFGKGNSAKVNDIGDIPRLQKALISPHTVQEGGLVYVDKGEIVGKIADLQSEKLLDNTNKELPLYNAPGSINEYVEYRNESKKDNIQDVVNIEYKVLSNWSSEEEVLNEKISRIELLLDNVSESKKYIKEKTDDLNSKLKEYKQDISDKINSKESLTITDESLNKQDKIYDNLGNVVKKISLVEKITDKFSNKSLIITDEFINKQDNIYDNLGDVVEKLSMFEKIKEKDSKIIDKGKETVSNFIPKKEKTVAEAAKNTTEEKKGGFFGTIGRGISFLMGGLFSGIKTFFKKMYKVLKDIPKRIVNRIINMWEKHIKPTWLDLQGKIVEGFNKVSSTLKEWFEGGFSGFIKRLPEIFHDTTEKLLTGFTNYFNEKLGVVATSPMDIIKKTYQTIIPDVVKQGFKDLYTGMGDSIEQISKNIGDISLIIINMKNSVKEYVSGVIEPMKTAWKDGNSLSEKFINVLKSIPTVLKNTVFGFVEMIWKLGNSLYDLISPIYSLSTAVSQTTWALSMGFYQSLKDIRVEFAKKILPKKWAEIYKTIEERIHDSYRLTMDSMFGAINSIMNSPTVFRRIKKGAMKKGTGIIYSTILGIIATVKHIILQALKPIRKFGKSIWDDLKKLYGDLVTMTEGPQSRLINFSNSFGNQLQELLINIKNFGKQVKDISIELYDFIHGGISNKELREKAKIEKKKLKENTIVQKVEEVSKEEPKTKMAEGGIVHSAQEVIVGEKGPEAIIPLNSNEAVNKISKIFSSTLEKLGLKEVAVTIVDRLDKIIKVLKSSKSGREMGLLARIAKDMSEVSAGIIKLPLNLTTGISSGIAKGLGKMFGGGFSLIPEFLKTINKTIGLGIDTIGFGFKTLGGIMKAGLDSVGEAIHAGLKFISFGIDTVKKAVGTALTAISTGIKAAWATVTAPFKAIKNLILRPFELLKTAATKTLEKGVEIIQEARGLYVVGGTRDKPLYAKWPGRIIDILHDILLAIRGEAPEEPEKEKTFFEKVKDYFIKPEEAGKPEPEKKSLFSRIKEKGVEAKNSLIGSALGIKEKLFKKKTEGSEYIEPEKRTLKERIQGIKESAKEKFTKFKEYGESKVSSLSNAPILTMLSGIRQNTEVAAEKTSQMSWLTHKGNQARDIIKNISVKTWKQNLLDKFLSIKNIFSGLFTKLSMFIPSISGIAVFLPKLVAFLPKLLSGAVTGAGLGAGVMGIGYGVHHAVQGVKKAKEWHGVKEGEEASTSQKATAAIGGFLGGVDSGLAGAMQGVAKGAGIGAGIGTVVGGPVGTAIGGAIGAIAGGIWGAIGGENIAKGIQYVWDGTKKLVKGIWSFITYPFKLLSEIVKKAKDWIMEKYEGLSSEQKSIVKGVFDFITFPYRMMWKAMVGVKNIIMKGLGAILHPVETIKKMFHVYSNLDEYTRKWNKQFKNFVGNIIKKFDNFTGKIANLLKMPFIYMGNLVKKAKDWIVKKYEEISFMDIGKKIFNFITYPYQLIWKAIVSVKEWIVKKYDDIMGSQPPIVKKIFDFITLPQQFIWKAVVGIKDLILNGIDAVLHPVEAWNKLKDMFINIKDKIIDTIKYPFKKFGELISIDFWKEKLESLKDIAMASIIDPIIYVMGSIKDWIVGIIQKIPFMGNFGKEEQGPEMKPKEEDNVSKWYKPWSWGNENKEEKPKSEESLESKIPTNITPPYRKSHSGAVFMGSGEYPTLVKGGEMVVAPDNPMFGRAITDIFIETLRTGLHNYNNENNYKESKSEKLATPEGIAQHNASMEMTKTSMENEKNMKSNKNLQDMLEKVITTSNVTANIVNNMTNNLSSANSVATSNTASRGFDDDTEKILNGRL